MRLVTDGLNDIVVVTESDGTESITVETPHGKVEITIASRSATITGDMTTQVFQAFCETRMATVETSAIAHLENDKCCGNHNTEVIR